MRMKELQDSIAPFGVHNEVQSYDLKCKVLGTAIIWMAQIQCPA